MLLDATRLVALSALLVVEPRLFGAARPCVMFPETEELFKVNDVVFMGTVLSNAPVPGPDDGVQNVGMILTERFWRGTPSREVRVGSDLPFRVGEQDIVLAGGDLLSTTIACEATQPRSKAMKRREWPSRHPSRTAG